MQKLRLKDLTTDQFYERLEPLGMGWREARALQGIAMHKRMDRLPDLPPRNVRRLHWDVLRERVDLPNIDLVSSSVSNEDGFAKFLFRGEGGSLFEAVRIPLLHRPGDEKYVVCVSSQVGCTAGCTFCATGAMGFSRNLHAWEIVDQVVKIQDNSQHPVRGVVFMGMGEPLLNYGNVMRAARVMTEPSGLAIDGKAITISTVGIVPGMRRFTAALSSHRLIVSLHSAIPERRAEIVPITKLYPLDRVFEALKMHYAERRKRIPLAWTLIAGVNTGLDEVKALAAWTRDLPVVIDMIPVNDASGRYQPPGKEELDQFVAYLREHVRQPIAMRYSGGKDINGACGMLAARPN